MNLSLQYESLSFIFLPKSLDDLDPLAFDASLSDQIADIVSERRLGADFHFFYGILRPD